MSEGGEGGQDDRVVRLSRYDQAVIGRLLRDMYRHFVREGIPPHLMHSFRRLEERLNRADGTPERPE